MFMLMYISKDALGAEEMLDVWVKAGIEGVTIIESAGMQQTINQGLREDFGLFVSMRKLLQSQEIHHRTLFSVVRDETKLKAIIAASEAHVQDWSHPDVGVLFAWPITHAYGMDKNLPGKD